MRFIFIFILLIGLVGAYTAPNYDSVDLVLNTGYTAPNYDSVDLVLGVASSANVTNEISISRIYPTTNINVTQNEFFNVTLNVTCLIGTCGTINVSLDPTIKIQDNVTGNLADLQVQDSSSNNSALFKFNISQIPINNKITDSTLCLYQWIDGDSDIFNIYRYANQTWDEDTTASEFNSTKNDLYNFTQTTWSGNGWNCVNVTNHTSTEYNLSNNFVSFWVESDNYIIGDITTVVRQTSSDVEIGGAGAAQKDLFYTREYSTSSQRPYLNITYSTSLKSGLISTVIGTTPFYTNSTNPFTTSSLSEGQSEIVTFWVNATGTVDTTHDFFAWANMTSNESVSNLTTNWNVTIVTETPTDTCTYSSGDWNVDCSDNCDITSNVNLGGNNLILSGVGNFFVNANITNIGGIDFGTATNICKMVVSDGNKLVF